MPENELIEEAWGAFGPAMRALPNDRQRRFVLLYCSDPKAGAATRAYLEAGFNCSRKNAPSIASRLLDDQRIIDAITETSRKILRAGHPQAVAALLDVVGDPAHPHRVKAAAVILDRADPSITRTDMRVAHEHRVTISADEEALEQYRAMLELGVTREKLREVFGGNYLPKLERMLEDKTKQIEHKDNG